MKLDFAYPFSNRPVTDLLLLPLLQGQKPSSLEDSLQEEVEAVLKTEDFSGKVGQTLLFYPKGEKEKRVLLVGLGKEEALQEESFRRSIGSAIRSCQKKKINSVCLHLSSKLPFSSDRGLELALEAIFFANYHFTHSKNETLKESPIHLLESVVAISKKKNFSKWVRIEKLTEALGLARNLVNRNADEVTPEELAKVALKLSKLSSKVSVKVLDKKELEKEKMGLLLAVGRSSRNTPKLIILSYKGNPKSSKKLALVGKGVTYDTGGLSLKPTPSMLTMRADMGGAAAVLGTMLACILLDIPKNIVGVIPTTENSIDADSYKIGDVYTAYSGKTVEITNTDAEGRLILADAISYTLDKIKPDAMVTLATLTGGVVVALGEEMTGSFSTSEKLQEMLKKASEKTGELIWPLPFYLPYKKMLASEVADIKNSAGREASSIQGALFLHAFVNKKIPFAHLDIAGTAFLSKAVGYHPAQATGMPVRLLVDLIETYTP